MSGQKLSSKNLLVILKWSERKINVGRLVMLGKGETGTHCFVKLPARSKLVDCLGNLFDQKQKGREARAEMQKAAIMLVLYCLPKCVFYVQAPCNC